MTPGRLVAVPPQRKWSVPEVSPHANARTRATRIPSFFLKLSEALNTQAASQIDGAFFSTHGSSITLSRGTVLAD